MNLFDKYRKYYRVKCTCTNCSKVSEQKIPLGTTIDDYFKKNLSKCNICGCTTMKKSTPEEILKYEVDKLRRDGW